MYIGQRVFRMGESKVFFVCIKISLICFVGFFFTFLFEKEVIDSGFPFGRQGLASGAGLPGVLTGNFKPSAY